MKETTFGNLSVGDKFAISRGVFHSGVFNMKVQNAFMQFNTQAGRPYNAVNLITGEIRTFDDEETVFKAVEDILIRIQK